MQKMNVPSRNVINKCNVDLTTNRFTVHEWTIGDLHNSAHFLKMQMQYFKSDQIIVKCKERVCPQET
jgi:hypothetical protein